MTGFYFLSFVFISMGKSFAFDFLANIYMTIKSNTYGWHLTDETYYKTFASRRKEPKKITHNNSTNNSYDEC